MPRDGFSDGFCMLEFLQKVLDAGFFGQGLAREATEVCEGGGSRHGGERSR